MQVLPTHEVIEEIINKVNQYSKSITEIAEEVSENVCDNFCKYRDTCDENNECEWTRNGNKCPLDRLH